MYLPYFVSFVSFVLIQLRYMNSKPLQFHTAARRWKTVQRVAPLSVHDLRTTSIAVSDGANPIFSQKPRLPRPARNTQVIWSG